MKDNYKLSMLFYYKEARNRFIDLSTNDPASILAKENAIQGLTTLLKCYHENGLPYDNVYIVALPDFTYTRNRLRWNSGFSYGCILFLDQTDAPFIPLEARPNACGIIFSKILEWDFKGAEFCNLMTEVFSSYNEIDIDDFKKRNHFFAVYTNEKKDEFYVLLHGSFSRIKQDSSMKPGLYVERSKYWQENSMLFQQGRLQFHYLVGDKALEYYKYYLEHEKFSMNFRKKILDDLLGHHQIVFHSTHEGFYDISTLLLGCYASKRKFVTPIMLSPDAYLPYISIDNTIRNITSGKIERDLYCTPHGGGYLLEGVTHAATEGIATNIDSRAQYICLEYKGQNYQLYTNNVSDMPFSYRKNTAEVWCSDFNAGKVLGNLIPIFSAKV